VWLEGANSGIDVSSKKFSVMIVLSTETWSSESLAGEEFGVPPSECDRELMDEAVLELSWGWGRRKDSEFGSITRGWPVAWSLPVR
jgi:hypothetical protein